VSEAIAPRTRDAHALARWALKASAIAWFVPALLGQLFFAYHIAHVYIATALAGNFAAWDKRLFVGFVSGDLVGNVALVAHVFIAFVITVGGILQLIPRLRASAPAFHRWNGRIYIVIAFVTSLASLRMIWTRDTFGGILANDIAQSINAVLIMVFAAIALRHAMARRIAVHQRWALRTFMAVSGVWSQRVMGSFLKALPGDFPGMKDDMTGPTNVAVNFASYLLPLAVLELWFLARRSPSLAARYATAALVLAAAGATSIGVYRWAWHWLR
jgi:hypothetical protein